MLLYDNAVSGNCYKARLLLAQLGLAYERRPLSVVERSNRGEVLGGLNPALRVPTLVLDDGRPIAESGAILWYFGEGTRFVPAERYDRAKVLQWMFFEQYSHEPCIAVARAILRYQPPDSPRRAELPRLQERGRKALAVMEQHLGREPFFAAGRYTIADIALYAYTHCAADGGFDLGATPAVRAWLERVRAQPRHVPLG